MTKRKKEIRKHSITENERMNAALVKISFGLSRTLWFAQ
jgi:hypothetical protein